MSLTPIDTDVLGFYPGVLESDQLWLWSERAARLAGKTEVGRTDLDGSVSLPRPGTPADDSFGAWALWVSHSEFAADVRLLGSPGSDNGGEFAPLDGPHEIALQPGPAASVRVLGPTGDVVTGARIEQLALLPLGTHPMDAAMEVRARRALVRGGATDAGGLHTLEVYMGRQMVLVDAVLREGLHRAVVQLERPTGVIDVRLQPTFELAGRVGWEGDKGPGEWGLVAVDAVPDVGQRPLLGVAHIGPDGSFGPVHIPLPLGVPQFRVRVGNTGLVPCSKTIERPTPNERVWVDFTTRAGFSLWVQTVDKTTDTPLPDTRVSLFWSDPEGRADAWTSSIGWLQFEALPETSVTLIAGKQGYGRVRLTPVPLSADTWEGGAMRVDLEPAGRLTGTVVDGSEPATEFELFVTHPDGMKPSESWQFSDRRDGSFELHELAPGDYIVRALLAGARVTQPESVSISLERTAEVRLEAVAGVEVVGRVLDADERKPMSGVAVRTDLADRSVHGVLNLGAVVTTGHDGRFEIAYAPPGQTLIVLTGPNGEEHLVPLPSGTEASLDLGDIVLTRTPSIDVEVLGDPGRAMTDLWVSSYQVPEGVQLSERGKATLGARAKGDKVVLHHRFTERDVVRVADPSNQIRPLHLHVRPGRVDVQLRGGGGAVDAMHFVHFLRYADPEGQPVLRFGEQVGRTWSLAGIAATQAQIFVHAADGDLFATSSVQIDAAGNGSVGLDLGPSAWIRLVDENGAALADAPVEICLGSTAVPNSIPPERAFARYEGNPTGRVRVPGNPDDADEVWLAQGVTAQGVRFGEWALPRVQPGAEPVDVVVRLDLGLTIQVHELGQAVPHASFRVLGARGGTPFFVGSTDTSGDAAFGPFGLAAVWVELTDPRFFALPRAATLAPQGTLVPIEAFARGDLELRVVDAEGRAAPGAVVSLVHEELAVDVGLLLAEGRVQGSLVADAVGEIGMVGLPRGRYRVAVESSAGSTAGELVLSAGETNRLTLALP